MQFLFKETFSPVEEPRFISLPRVTVTTFLAWAWWIFRVSRFYH